MNFNLVDEPWIPVEAGVANIEVSITDALERASELGRISGADAPTMPIVILRQVLLPIVLDAFGMPRSRTEWGERWSRGHFDPAVVESYLEEHRARFDLFHPEQPFAQVGGLEAVNGEYKPSSLLMPALAAGNTVPLWAARTEADPPALRPAQAARWLLHTHGWDTAAIKSGAVGDPAVTGGKTMGNPTGPLGQLGVVMPIGRTLFETLLLNLPINEDGLAPEDVPQWRRPPATPVWDKRMPLGYLDLFTWQSRRVGLIPEEDPDTGEVRVSSVVVAAGDRMPATPLYDPHTTWRVIEKPAKGEPPMRPRRLISGKAAWRGLDSLLALPAVLDGQKQVETSRLLSQISALQLTRQLGGTYPLRVEVVGIEYGSKSAVIENVIADSIPLPLAALLADGRVRSTVERLAEDAESLAAAVNRLDGDLRQASGGDPTPWNQGQRPGTEVIQLLDPVVRRILAGLRDRPDLVDRALDAWEIVAREIVWQVGDRLFASVTPSAFVGRTEGKRVHRVATAEFGFRRRVNEVLPVGEQHNGNELTDSIEEAG